MSLRIVSPYERETDHANRHQHALGRLSRRPAAPGETPRNEVLVSGHLSPSEAMDEANRLKRLDRAHSYTVGAA
jgi:hypothetical protein